MERLPSPRTLRQVGLYAADGEDYVSAMKEFLDILLWDLQAKGASRDDRPLPVDASMIEEPPPVLGVPILDAHIAGIGEYIAELGGIPAPKWTERPEAFMADPVRLRYGGGGETPAPFARRGLLCGPSLQKVFAVLPERVEARAVLGR